MDLFITTLHLSTALWLLNIMKISRSAHPAVIVLASITLMAMLIRVIPSTEAAKQIEPNTAASPSDAAPIQFPQNPRILKSVILSSSSHLVQNLIQPKLPNGLS